MDNLIDRVFAILMTCTIELSELNSALYFIAQFYLIEQLINRLWGLLINCAILLSIHFIDNLIDRVFAILTTCTIVLSELNSALYFIAQVF